MGRRPIGDARYRALIATAVDEIIVGDAQENLRPHHHSSANLFGQMPGEGVAVASRRFALYRGAPAREGVRCCVPIVQPSEAAT